VIIQSGRVLFLFAIILPLNADNVEIPLADLLLRADPIVLGRIGVGLPVRDESLLQSLKPVAQGEWRKTELCQFVLTSEQIIRSSVPLDSIGLDVYMFGEKGSCDLSYARVTPGERYLWLLREERGILRAVVDTHQARVLVRSLPHAWQTVTIDREWQWKVTYLLTAPDTPDTLVSDRFTGDLVDAVGWHLNYARG